MIKKLSVLILALSIFGTALYASNPPISIQDKLTLVIPAYSVSIPFEYFTEHTFEVLIPFCEENWIEMTPDGYNVVFTGTGWVVFSIEDYVLNNGPLIGLRR